MLLKLNTLRLCFLICIFQPFSLWCFSLHTYPSSLILYSSSFHLFAHFSGISSVSLSHNLPFLPFFPPLSHFSPFFLFAQSPLTPRPSQVSSIFFYLLSLFFLSWNLHHCVWLRMSLSTRVQGVSSIFAFQRGEVTQDARYATWLEGTQLSTSPKDQSYPGKIVQNGVHSHHLLSCLPPCPDIKPWSSPWK